MSAIKNFYLEELGDEFDETLDDIETIDEIDEILDDEFSSFHNEDEIDIFEAEFPQWFRDSYNH